MGMGFELCKMGFGKKNEVENGTAIPLQDPLLTAYKNCGTDS